MSDLNSVDVNYVRELLKRLAGRRVVVSVSGGKDSASMCLLLKELGIPFEMVFMDTGWEHPHQRLLTTPPVSRLERSAK
jgi:tRNA(Ile)-lysidine synthase TilS/MesJ